MTLKDTEDKLYDPKSDIEKREHGKSFYDIELSHDAGENFIEHKSGWERFKSDWLDGEKRMAIYAGSFILGVIIFGVLIFFIVDKLKSTAFSEKNVIVSIEGETSVDSAEEVKYTVRYKNKNRVSLKGAELILNHSENFYPDETEGLRKITNRSSRLEIKDIGPFGSGKIEVSGKFYASENYLVYLQPVLKYEPSNFSSLFEATSQLGVRIVSSPINLTINVPKEALDESSVEYEVAYENKDTQNLTDLNLRLEYSDGFIFQSSTPQPVKDNKEWHLGNLDVGASGSIKIKGKMDGEQYDVKLVKATIYKNENNGNEVVFGRAEGVTKIVVAPLFISHKLNGKNDTNINLGEDLKYQINYANRGGVGLKDVIVKIKIDSPILDYENIKLKKGSYNSKTRDITWKASDIPQLEKMNPGDVGQIEFSIPVKEKIDITSADDKNFVVESVATIDSSDVAFHSLGNSKNISNTVLAKLNSKVILESKIYFKDGDIENYGTIPQKVGEETTYTVSWRVSNVSNDISDVKVSAFLPTWINWKGVIVPEGEKISFNERTHEIIWEIGDLENGRGILNSPKEVKFQISLTPEINQVNQLVVLIYEAKATGRDNFSGNIFDVKVGNGNLNLEEFENSGISGSLISK